MLTRLGTTHTQNILPVITVLDSRLAGGDNAKDVRVGALRSESADQLNGEPTFLVSNRRTSITPSRTVKSEILDPVEKAFRPLNTSDLPSSLSVIAKSESLKRPIRALEEKFD